VQGDADGGRHRSRPRCRGGATPRDGARGRGSRRRQRKWSADRREAVPAAGRGRVRRPDGHDLRGRCAGRDDDHVGAGTADH
jgi:hypothetical protein